MARRSVTRDMTIEEYDAWSASTNRHEQAAEQADESGGPRLSLVPAAEQNAVWPTDLLASADLRADGASPTEAMPFDGVALTPSPGLAGWSAERQRLFLNAPAETGSAHVASASARLSARSAYALRTRSPAFAHAWNIAQQMAVGRLSALAFDRAINGRVEQVYHDGQLIGERRVPSDRLLTWLLARLDPKRFALPWEQRGDGDPQAEAVSAFPSALDGLSDQPA